MRLKLLVATIISLFMFVKASGSAFAATSFSFTPSSGTYSKDATVKVNVYANTNGENVNAVQANVSYPVDKLQFQSISTGGSALTIFAEKSASSGVVRIAGGTPSPGFSGNKFIASITFKVLEDTGAVALSFTGESAALRDSDNVNILSGKGTANFTLGKASVTTPTPTNSTTASGTKSAGAIAISNVMVESINTNTAVISWKTDIKSTSSVEYGKDSEYGFTESSTELTTDHKITLSNYLLPGTTYVFKVLSADSSGKEAISEESSFKTKGYQVVVRVKDGSGKAVVGASVTIYSDVQEGKTNENGEVTFNDMSPGKHGVIVKNNNQTMINEVEVSDSQPISTIDLAFASQKVKVPDVSTPLLFSFVGGIILLVVLLLVYYFVKQRKNNIPSDTTTV